MYVNYFNQKTLIITNFNSVDCYRFNNRHYFSCYHCLNYYLSLNFNYCQNFDLNYYYFNYFNINYCFIP